MSRGPRKSQGLGVNSYGSVDKLNDYKIISCIGQGSFGVIHKVERSSDKTIFAMKQLDYSKMSPKDRRQMLQEVSILDSLNHPNVVMLYDKILDKEEQKIYIVMEFCGGGDLGRIITSHKRSGKPIAENTIWQYFTQLVLALHHCHWPEDRERLAKDSLSTPTPLSDTYGIGDLTLKRRISSSDGAGQVLHRDLKPENIFLNEKQDMLKLGDFGLSKNLGGQMFTQTYVGTPLYMPPEILQENRYDTKSDIWSLGCLIFELCTLSSPFATARSQPELITMVNSGRVPSMPSYLSAKLKETVRSMLTLQASRRPSTTDLMKIPEIDFQRKLMNLTLRTDHIVAYKHRVEVHAKAVSAKEREVLERERRLAEREKLLREGEEQLLQQSDNARAQYGEFLKNRTAFDAERAVFERQKMLWEREKGTILQAARAQRAGAPPTENLGGARTSGTANSMPSTAIEAKDSPASILSSEERLVNKMVGGTEEGLITSKSSPSLSTNDSDVSSRRSLIPTRHALLERSFPNTSLGRGRPGPTFEADTPCKMLGSCNPADISRMLIDSPASSRTPLRAKAQTRSMGNLRDQVKLNLENMPPSPESEDGTSPMDQGTPFADRLSGVRASVSSPSEYRSRLEKANERKMAEARAELATFKPSTRLRGSSAMPVPVSRLPTFTWRENMTPAKWTPESGDDFPSPFLKPPPPPMPTLTRAKLGGGSDLRQLAFKNAHAAITDASHNGQ